MRGSLAVLVTWCHSCNAQVEKHIRKNNLTVTFTDQLGQAKHSEHVTGEKEARKLAFYLFWNIKPYFTRLAPLHQLRPMSPN